MKANIAPVLGAMFVACGGQPLTETTTREITGVFSTGVDSRGELLATGAADPHYVLSASVDDVGLEQSPLVVDDFAWRALGGPWLPNDETSQWIGPVRSVGTNAPEGEYRYAISFDLTGFNREEVWLRGRWAADDLGASVHLNGVDTELPQTNAFDFSAEFTLSRGFVAGVNVLEFIVWNLGPDPRIGSNPTGLRVELTGGAAL